jgi:hypothetical protein
MNEHEGRPNERDQVAGTCTNKHITEREPQPGRHKQTEGKVGGRAHTWSAALAPSLSTFVTPESVICKMGGVSEDPASNKQGCETYYLVLSPVTRP